MTGVLFGLAVVAFVIAVGYLVARLRLLGEHSGYVMSRLAFFVLSPCLLFDVLSHAEVRVLFSSVLMISALAALAAFVVYIAIARFIWRRPVGDIVIGALGSGYVNAANVGIPVASYVLGDAAFSAPIILLQLLIFAPVALAVLDVSARGRVSVRRIVLSPLTNPIIVGSLLGVLVAVTGVEVPTFLTEPISMIGAAAVPVILLTFGMAMNGKRPLSAGTNRRDVIVAAAIKLALMPVVAWLLGRFVWGLDDFLLLGVVLMAALPSAQNVFNYAQRYDRAVVLARDVVLVTTIGCLPALAVVAALLAR